MKSCHPVTRNYVVGSLRGNGDVTISSCVLAVASHHHDRRCLNNPIFSNLGLCAPYWAHFMCHHELWPTSVGHPFSFLNSSLDLAGGKHYQKIAIPIFRVVLQNFTFPCYFPSVLFYHYLVSLFFPGWFLLLQYGNQFGLRTIVNLCRVAVSNDKSTE